jgi:hypothetical protein
METPLPIFEHQTAAGEHVRIWRYKDGRFLLEHVKPTGKGTMIFCPTFEKALELWCQLEHGENLLQREAPTE